MIAAEAFANAVIGLAISWAVTWLLLGFTPVQSAGITALFFCLSFTRSYLIRLAFSRMAK